MVEINDNRPRRLDVPRSERIRCHIPEFDLEAGAGLFASRRTTAVVSTRRPCSTASLRKILTTRSLAFKGAGGFSATWRKSDPGLVQVLRRRQRATGERRDSVLSCDRCLDGRARVDGTGCGLQTGEFTRPILEVLIQEIGNLCRLLLQLLGLSTLSPLAILVSEAATHLLNRTTHPSQDRDNELIRSVELIRARVVKSRDRSLIILESGNVDFAEEAFRVRLARLVPQSGLVPNTPRKDVDAGILTIQRLGGYTDGQTNVANQCPQGLRRLEHLLIDVGELFDLTPMSVDDYLMGLVLMAEMLLY